MPQIPKGVRVKLKCSHAFTDIGFNAFGVDALSKLVNCNSIL